MKFWLFALVLLYSNGVMSQEFKEATVVVIDKHYTKTTAYKVPVGESLTQENIKIKVLSCKENEQKQLFAFIEFRQDKKTVSKQWVPIAEYNMFPFANERWDITIQKCE